MNVRRFRHERKVHVGYWHTLASRILDGQPITREEALGLLAAPAAEDLDILAAAYRLRSHYFGRRVQLHLLLNAQSGLCPEDCGYCSQSQVSAAPIPRYGLLSVDEIVAGAEKAMQAGARTYCIVTSGRSATDRMVQTVAEAAERIRSRYPLHLCACLGFLTPGQARSLKNAGIERYNHNLNTSADFYEDICSTHGYRDRLATLETVREAGLLPCSGLIVGMGETAEDLVQVAFALQDGGAFSIPVNFLHPIEGTPLEERPLLAPMWALRVLAMIRFVNPDREIRMAGGREVTLGPLQPLGLFVANSLFIDGYLTTDGQGALRDKAMLEEMGFEIDPPALEPLTAR